MNKANGQGNLSIPRCRCMIFHKFVKYFSVRWKPGLVTPLVRPPRHYGHPCSKQITKFTLEQECDFMKSIVGSFLKAEQRR